VDYVPREIKDREQNKIVEGTEDRLQICIAYFAQNSNPAQWLKCKGT